MDLKPGDPVILRSAAYNGWPATIHERHEETIIDVDYPHWSVTLRSGKHVCVEDEHVEAVESGPSIVRYWVDTPDFGGRWVMTAAKRQIQMYGWSDGVVTWTETRDDV